MKLNNKPRKAWAVSSVVCALLCIVVTLCFTAFIILNRTSWQGLGAGILLMSLIFFVTLTIIILGVLGTIFSIVGAVRRESRKVVVSGILLNLFVFLCLGMFYVFAFVLPSMRTKREREQERIEYLKTRTPEQHFFDLARSRGDLTAMQTLLKNGIDSNLTDESGTPVLFEAVIHNNSGAVCLLLYSGADPEVRDQQGRTALHLACIADTDSCVAELIEHGVDVQSLTSNGETPLDLINAANIGGFSCNREHIKLLLTKAAGANEQELKKLRKETFCRKHDHAWTKESQSPEAFQHRYVPDKHVEDE